MPGGDCDFGVCYPETATANRVQPKSGAVNILETYLAAREIVPTPPDSLSTAVWEPAYDCTTGYAAHTIWVRGDTTDSDEWDDDVLLHEFGHYLMDELAQIPQGGCDPNHLWQLSYPDSPNTAYIEGWAGFFSGAARVGTRAESLYVDNTHIGDGAAMLWCSLEDPWIGSEYSCSEFQGGPWCEGAVAGALWDIYDAHDEIPYPCYPAPELPDTALGDSLGMGLDEIWDVFDNYDPSGDPTNCRTVFHFNSGWNSLGYDRQFAVGQILLHHRIAAAGLEPPQGLQLFYEGGAVRLRWLRNPEADVQGYRVYRRDSGSFIAWSEWKVIDEVSDTTCIDSTGQFGVIDYEYKLTAFDALGNESGFSSSVVTPAAGVDGSESAVSAPLLSIGPNPTGGGLRIGWVADRAPSSFSLRVYDPAGRLVRDLSRAVRDAKGRTQVAWEGDDDQGHRVPPGIYFVRLEVNRNKATAKAIILR